MNKIISFYNQNRKKIWKYILILVLVLALVQILGFFDFLKGDENQLNNSNITEIENSNKESAIISDKSSVTGITAQTEVLNTAEKMVKQFIEYCNERDIESAYNMLSEDCKEELYQNDVNNFKILYYDEIFNNNTKLYTMQNWISNTYIVNLTEDSLSTGKINSQKIEDYMTIVKDDNGEYKLYINRYIGKRDINSSSQISNLTITVLNKQIYMDYEIYEFEIYNKTSSAICLDNKESTKSTYLLGNNDTKYISYINEIPIEELIIENNFKQKIKIKFNNSYTQNREIKSVCFSNIIFDYGNENRNSIFSVIL